MTARPADGATSGLGAAYGWFLTSSAAWFGCWGMQQVMFAWLVVDVLHEDPAWVGTAQMVQLLPSLAFLLLGGALADILERRTTLLLTHAGAAIAAAALVALVVSENLTFAWLLAYGAWWGTLQALHLPARDSLLFDVGKSALSRAVSGATLVQMVGQASGNLLVGAATWLGAPLVIGIQGALLLTGLAPTSKLPTGRSQQRASTGSAFGQIREGIGIVVASSRLWPLVMLISFNGVFFLGPYFVLLPILVRDVYGGGVAQLSLLMMMFPLGAISASAVLLMSPGIAHRGRLHILGQLGGALCLAGIGATPSFPVVLLLTYLWGLCGGAFLNMGRTLFQEATPGSHRGSALAVYALGLMGTAPIGTQGAGLLGAAVGPATGCVIAASVMIGFLAVCWLATPVRTLK